MKYQTVVTLVTLLLTSTIASWAQSTQRGFVYEYNDKMEKVPLNNVEVVVTNAASTVTDAKGEFTLRFRQLKPGDRIMVRRCIKPGYSIADEASLEHLYITGDDSQIQILLCKTEKLMEVRRNIVRQATAVATNRYEADQKQITIEYKQNHLTKEEYEEKLAQLKQNYEIKLDNIDNYIDRFVKLDLQALTAEEKKIMSYVRDGNFDKAIAAYDKLDLAGQLRRQSENVNRLEKASHSFEESEAKLHNQRKQIRNAVFRQVDMLRIQGGPEANQKISSLVHDLAMTDTTNVYNMLVYGRLLQNHNRYDEAFKVYQSLRSTAIVKRDSLRQMCAECYMAVCRYRRGDRVQGRADLEHALPLLDSLRRLQSDTLNLLRDEAEFCNLIGIAAFRNNEIDRADEYFTRSIRYLRMLRYETSLRDLDSQYAVLLCQAANYMRDYWGEKGISYCRESISILEEIFSRRGPAYEARLAFAYKCLGVNLKTLGRLEEAEEMLLRSERHYRKSIKRNVAAYRRFLAGCLYSLGELYLSQRMYEPALRCLDEARLLWIEEPGGLKMFADVLSDCNYAIGKCSYHLGDYQRALECDLTSLAVMEPLYAREPEVYRKEMGTRLLYLYNVYIRLKNYTAAKHYILRALEVNPDDEQIRRSYQEYITLMNNLKQVEQNNTYN